jgi:hypothetical protein
MIGSVDRHCSESGLQSHTHGMMLDKGLKNFKYGVRVRVRVRVRDRVRVRKLHT